MTLQECAEGQQTFSLTSLLRINQNPVVNQHDEIVFPITGNVSHDCFPWLGQITAPAAEGFLFKNLPAIGRYQLVGAVEDDQFQSLVSLHYLPSSIRQVGVIFLVAVVCGLMGRSAAGEPPAPKKVATVEGITEYQFDNGLRLLLFPDNSQSKVSVNMTVLVGSRQEGYGETGMAHLLEHMVFKGTPAHTNVPKSLNQHGAQWNGSTSSDRVNYFETLAATEDRKSVV